MIFIGIDNGLNGGIVALDENCKFINKWIMPVKKGKRLEYDIPKIVDIFETFYYTPENVLIILEQSHVRPISGKRACFMTGFGYGIMQGIIEAIGFKYIIVSPSRWMKAVLETKGKKGSIDYCLKYYPNEDWKRTKRSKKIHDGLTDACCIARYGIFIHFSNLLEEQTK